jgi:hypothetical protein
MSSKPQYPDLRCRIDNVEYDAWNLAAIEQEFAFMQYGQWRSAILSFLGAPDEKSLFCLIPADGEEIWGVDELPFKEQKREEDCSTPRFSIGLLCFGQLGRHNPIPIVTEQNAAPLLIYVNRIDAFKRRV